MARFVEELATYLDTQSTSLTLGTNLFINGVDESTRATVVVYETIGAPSVEKMGGNLPAIEMPRAQIVARSTKAVGGSGLASSTRARSLIQDAWEACIKVANQNVGNSSHYYERIEPLQSPFLLRRDEAGRVEFAVNVQAYRQPSTN